MIKKSRAKTIEKKMDVLESTIDEQLKKLMENAWTMDI